VWLLNTGLTVFKAKEGAPTRATAGIFSGLLQTLPGGPESNTTTHQIVYTFIILLYV